MRLLSIACCALTACAVDTQAASQDITSGVPATEFPETVVMRAPTTGCSGTLIAPRVVLTAGHCVLYGGTSWQVTAPYASGQTASSIDAVSLYNDGGNRAAINVGSYDLALVFLDRPISVPYAVLTRELFPAGWGVIVVGASAGGTGVQNPMRTDPVTAYNAPGYLYWYSFGGDARQQPGDSGGPVYSGWSHILVGVNSGANTGNSSLMMRTDVAVDWIYDQMEARGLQPSARPVPPWQACPGHNCRFDTLTTNDAVGAGDRIVSSDLKAELDVQGDGNVVLYYNGMALWSTRTWGTGPGYLVMQGDGNLVSYNGGGATWWSGTSGGNVHLSVQADCNLVLYDGGNQPLWSSGTAGCVNRAAMP